MPSGLGQYATYVVYPMADDSQEQFKISIS